ncbi:thiamine-phosphate kinase [Longibacter salinarum]|uniref:Thiamine-monophosphate kinase n=1 Tax=Longibacter salinarum TaxID=1850348 RepID=A0A2A8CWP6_9BACT|nr:thiamine-phosphate kinase [Longibacter salinarum]PEN13115.1 thiamine-phosphate kinase [Longibacter salinarum]
MDTPSANGPSAAGNSSQPEIHPQETSISEIGEFGLIAHLRETLGETDDESIVAGISDDAAVYRVDDDTVHVVTTDALIEGVHFDRTFMPMEHLGFKAMSANVSDIAAMNATPRYATVVIGVPKNASVEAIGTLYQGIKQACDAYGVTVIGGDTTGSHSLSVTVTVIGEASEEDVVYRRGAQPGDKICVTGDIGASYAGLKVLLRQREQLQQQGEDFQPQLDKFSYVIRRHLAPPAQVQAVREWRDAGFRPSSLIDISDGLASEVHHLCEASGTRAQMYEPSLPISPHTRNTATDFGEEVTIYALFGGEDYELVFTASEEELKSLDPQTFNVIGEMEEPDEDEPRVQLQQADGENVRVRPGGFDHFGDEQPDG